MSKNKILVFIATYNEKQNISDLFYNIIKISPEYDVLIIDDNSTDGSMSKANAQANLTSILQRPEFYSDNIKLKDEETYVIEMNLYKIDQK
jgi:dolichol-phosphate mannosyltransferase